MEQAQPVLRTLACAGDRVTTCNEAFAELVEGNARRMFRVAYSLLRHAHDAEDVVQEAFLKRYRTEGWRRMEDERAFMTRTVWRVAMDRLSSLRRREERRIHRRRLRRQRRALRNGRGEVTKASCCAAEILSLDSMVPAGAMATVRSNRWTGEVWVPVGGRTTFFSSDDLSSRKSMQIELMVTPTAER